MTSCNDPQGAVWRRWDPHIHAPGTILNDQYGKQSWDEFLRRIESADPPIQALGITDYYSLDCYEEVLEKQREGRLSEVGLIFPNIEMRYGIGTGKGNPINFHLLVSPEDPGHVEEIRRFLRSFTFDAHGDSYRCDKADLIRLGYACDSRVQDDETALAVGTNQFKVSPEQLRSEWRRNQWVRDNVLIAVAASSGDGTAGLQGDASLDTLRKEIERFARIIFSAQPKQREFWLGKGKASIADLNEKWDGCKPCLHGSDAHRHEDVGAPNQSRYCWIKGDATFDSLRHACLEPEARTIIGPAAPRGALPSQVITSVTVNNSSWLATPNIPLNAGLVGIIGARGSGKTALADMIAAGGFALSDHVSEQSFVRRARKHLANASATLTWEDGDPTTNPLDEEELLDFIESPRVQYLSQQFVDRLCSAVGVSDELLAEVERVIFQSHPRDERMEASTFRELLELRIAASRSTRASHEEALADTLRELNSQRVKKSMLAGLRKQRSEKENLIDKDKRDRTKLIAKGSEDRNKQFEQVTTAADAIRATIEKLRRRRLSLLALKNDVADTRQNKVPLFLRQLQQKHADAVLEDESWAAFRLEFTGNVDDILDRKIASVEKEIKTFVGSDSEETDIEWDAVDSEEKPSDESFLPEGKELTQVPLNLLDKEIARLRNLIGIDTEKSKAFKRLSEKISREEAALKKLEREIQVAEQADEKIKELSQFRNRCYVSIFDGIVAEERELTSLYEPLKHRLETESGALGKLSFTIRRIVDIEGWAQHGEDLLDLRKSGAFRGRGLLLEHAREKLLSAWESGSSLEVSEAIDQFRELRAQDFMEHCPVDRSDTEAVHEWARSIAEWLYSTEHINISYGVQYDGVNIEQLSPGTRGIVLLLLYLAIDQDDDRPLIIDQPEENLDPKSIFDELVDRFKRAKLRRQIIIVTHNANLIVNTDADQVIVATCGPHRPGGLPEISYQSGGLENPSIRKQVCEILEGGEQAFKERARRLRVAM
ncbi:TrlF family AAA-like ATPase [Alcaligenes phenolicus]|uniref:AAA family ATPase n=1 Tax=Alcaligenes phenolicus TaxID=232846 RepID=A0AAW5VT60_9BURK|nr:AAA family ATPase [Alcaligenes phenolicus]MCX5565654.1 AAA family ATPase [Alcaligenes phenolicus]